MADYSLVAELKANTEGFVSGLKKGEQSLINFGGVVDKILGPKGKLVMAIATATTAALKIGQAMNKALGEIAKGTGATGEQLEKFSNSLNNTLVKGVNNASKDVAKAMADINTRFKLTDSELEQLTIDFDKFATVTDLDVASSVDKVADVLAKWNIETKDATGLMDQLTVASQETGISVDELLGELKTGQAVFSQLGMSATDTIAYLGHLKENGIDSKTAMTGLRTALAKFSQEGKNARDEFKNVSERIKNAKTETEALTIAVETFGSRSGAEMVKALRNASGAADELKDKLLEAGGAVERTAEATRTSKDAFKNLGDTLGATFSGLFMGLDSLFKGTADALNNVFKMLNPIIMPLFNIVKDILSSIGTILSELTGNIKDYVLEYSFAFNAIISVSNSAYKIIHNIMKTMTDTFGTAFGFIFSLMQGKFALAWEHLKKLTMLGAKYVLDLISDLLNTFKDQINNFIDKVINPFIDKVNWVEEKMHRDKTEKITLFGDFNLSEASGLDAQIEKVTKKIEELSGKSKSKITSDLGEATNEFDGATAEIEDDIKDVGDTTEDEEENTRKVILAGIQIVSKAFVNVCKGITKGFATAFQTVGKIISKTLSAVKNAVSGTLSAIKKVVSFSVDDSLDALLAFEDSILTFFVETLPKLPQFIESAFGSVISLLETLDSVIDFDKLESDLSSMINTISDKLPQAFEKAFGLFTRTFDSLSTAIQENAPEIVSAFGSMFFTVAEALPGIIYNLFATIGSLLSELGKYLTANKDRFETALKNIISSIVNGISEFVKNGGLKNLLDGLLAVQQAIEDAVSDNIEGIGDFISEALPDIMEFLKKSIISASETMGEIAPTLLKALGELIGAIFQVAFDPKVIESSFGALRGIIDGFIQGIVEFVVKIIPILIEALVAAPKFIPELISGILSGIVDGFLHANWLGIVEACFNGFIDGFKDLFGIHSPSTVFEGFGGNIVEGLKIGLEGFAEVLEVLMEPLETLVDNLTNFSSIGGGFEKMFNGIANVIKVSGKVIIGVLGGVVSALADVHNELRDIIKSVTSIKVWTPWKTYTIGGVDIGKVSTPDVSKYVSIIDALADGTNNARKGLTLVGEAGPELVNFRGGEQVLNNRNTQKALNNMGGNTNNFNVTFNNLQDTTAFAMMQQLKAYNRQLAINSVI